MAMSEVLHPCYLARTWQQQYAMDLHVPSAADIAAYSHLKDEKLKLPLYCKKPAGRPKNGGRFPGLFEQLNGRKKTKKVVCDYCQMVGHDTSNCPWYAPIAS